MDDVRMRRGWLVVFLSMVCGGLTVVMSTEIAKAQGSKPVNVRVVDKAGYDKVIAANKGKVIVVDCWATWCVPCRKAFPKTVELSKTYANQGVVVISLCFDDLVDGQASDKVKKFLTTSNADFENLISSLEFPTKAAPAFGITDDELPHFKIYGKDGKLVKTFESGENKAFTHEDIEAAVKSALKAAPK